MKNIFGADVVDGREVVDTEEDRNILAVPFEERINVTQNEKEHLLKDYTIFVMNTIVAHFPEAFPNLKSIKLNISIPENLKKKLKFSLGHSFSRRKVLWKEFLKLSRNSLM